jgi:hypothetical protein
MSGSFHQGLTVQAGTDSVDFRVTVGMVLVPEHWVMVAHYDVRE